MKFQLVAVVVDLVDLKFILFEALDGEDEIVFVFKLEVLGLGDSRQLGGYFGDLRGVAVKEEAGATAGGDECGVGKHADTAGHSVNLDLFLTHGRGHQ